MYVLEYRYVDAGGNTGNVVTRTITVEDQTAPATPASAADLQTGSDSGVSASDDLTSATTPSFDIVCSEI